MESCIRDAYRKNCKISLKENWKYRIRNTVESCTHTGNGIFPDIFRGRGLTCGGVGGAWREEQSSFADRSETKLSRNFRRCSPPPFHLWSIRAREQGDRLSAMKERDRKEKWFVTIDYEKAVPNKCDWFTVAASIKSPFTDMKLDREQKRYTSSSPILDEICLSFHRFSIISISGWPGVSCIVRWFLIFVLYNQCWINNIFI